MSHIYRTESKKTGHSLTQLSHTDPQQSPAGLMQDAGLRSSVRHNQVQPGVDGVLRVLPETHHRLTFQINTISFQIKMEKKSDCFHQHLNPLSIRFHKLSITGHETCCYTKCYTSTPMKYLEHSTSHMIKGKIILWTSWKEKKNKVNYFPFLFNFSICWLLLRDKVIIQSAIWYLSILSLFLSLFSNNYKNVIYYTSTKENEIMSPRWADTCNGLFHIFSGSPS